jgi:hypothetical protein
MSRRQNSEMVIGEDAFLDTVANLVGILIILVVIVSTGTRSAANLLTAEKLQESEKKLEQPVSTASSIEKDLLRQQEQLAEHTLEVAYRSAERDTILEKLLLAKERIEDEKSTLTEGQRADLETQQMLNEMERKLAQLLQQQGDDLSKEKPPIVLQHLPTPMAKTVFGKEMHLMVRDGLVTVIPWDLLVDKLKEEARNAVARSTRRDRIAEQLGPIDGFNMDYVMVSKRGLVSNGTSTSMAQMIELDKFELVPTNEIVRESLDVALGSNGRLRIEMSGYRPRETTVTAWVYPNSFETFRQLKERLFQEGFMTAARPLPDGMRIGASPRGSQSTAQ